MKICIASGKGGTGKTIVATNLVAVLGEGTQYLDCDVEEPNGYLFLRPKFEYYETVSVPVPKVDLEKCDFCRKCADFCQFNAISVLGKTVLTFPELCHSCGGCKLICPKEAIFETKKEIGKLEKGMAKEIEFVCGQLRVGEPMAVPLIERVKKEIKPDKIVIIDAPPGTSCPVIAALKGVDMALLVTEPTPFGLYDLKLAVSVVRILEIPLAVVVNRANLGDKEVFDYCTKENIPIFMVIPFDKKIAQTYAQGRLLVKDSFWYAQFLTLWSKIKEIIGG
jgi:MinD superfamily P-loop ATPase